MHAELRDRGWKVTKKTVAASMARQGLFARPPKRPRRCTTRQDSKAPPAPDLLQRRFGADGLNQKWCGDLTEIPTDEGKLYLAIVEDLCSRRVPGFALDEHHDAELATGAVTMAAAARGGDVAGVIFHSDRGSEYTSRLFAGVCERLHITQSMGRVGSALDNAPAESFFSTLEWECLRRRRLASKAQARRVIADWIDRYNRTRRHSSIGMMSPVDYELALATAQQGEAA